MRKLVTAEVDRTLSFRPILPKHPRLPRTLGLYCIKYPRLTRSDSEYIKVYSPLGYAGLTDKNASL